MAGERRLLDAEVLRAVTGDLDVMPIFQVLCAQVAATCASLSKQLTAAPSQAGPTESMTSGMPVTELVVLRLGGHGDVESTSLLVLQPTAFVQSLLLSW